MFVPTRTSVVLAVFDDAMDAQINAQYQEQYRAYMPEPFLECLHLTG